MADNVTLDAGSGGDTIAADDVGGVKYQVVKLDVGGDGVAAPLSTSNPVPVSDAGGALTVDGTVTANLGATDNAVLDAIQVATEATQAAVEGTVTVSGTVTVQDGGGAITVDGTVAVTNGGLTELAAAINASSQLDVNIAASNATVAVSNAGLTALDGAISGTEVQVDVVGALPAGTNNIGDVDIASIAAGDNNIGNVDIASSVLPTGAATSANQRGASHYRNVDANAEVEIKASAGTLVWMHVMNMTAAVAYVHLYDATAANVTPGTTTPNYTFPVGTQGDTNGAGFFARIDQAFANGITIVVTTTIDGSAGDPGTNGVFVNAGYT